MVDVQSFIVTYNNIPCQYQKIKKMPNFFYKIILAFFAPICYNIVTEIKGGIKYVYR